MMTSEYTSATVCHEIYKIYKDILNCYVSDYYIERHWDKLPHSWKYWLEQLTIDQIANVLDCNNSPDHVVPLSVACLRQIIRDFCVNRKQTQIYDKFNRDDDSFKKMLFKKVKQKKRHEIEIMSEICHKTALQTNCFNIVDIGSGLGHLSRMLAYQYGFNICTFEANEYLSNLATKLDMDFEKILAAKKIPHLSPQKILHVNEKIEETISSQELLNKVKNAFNFVDSNFKFGIIGLHCCGNLGSTLLKFYSNCPNVIFVNLVSCCYMKLSLDDRLSKGFPLSKFCNEHRYYLDYESCELACHAIENYIQKLSTSEYHFMKVHAYRAGLEQLIVDSNKDMKHSQVGNVKFDRNMTFQEYCEKAKSKKLDLKLKYNVKHYETLIEETWDRVVKFYSVRLLLAPIVESIILYDRLLFLYEGGSACKLVPAFDSNVSPRNHILTAYKTYS